MNVPVKSVAVMLVGSFLTGVLVCRAFLGPSTQPAPSNEKYTIVVKSGVPDALLGGGDRRVDEYTFEDEALADEAWRQISRVAMRCRRGR